MRRGAGLRMNREDLAVVAVAGQIAHPVGHVNAYRIGHDGVARVLPGTGGIVLNVRIGDRCVGLAGDHIEPGVALHNNQREVVGPRDGPNNALMTYCCVGNRARVISGPCAGRLGRVTGKHGGINHVLLDFPPAVLRGLCIGDRIQVYSCGLGLRLLDHPRITVLNSAPGLLDRWRIGQQAGRLLVPVTHLVPGALVGSASSNYYGAPPVTYYTPGTTYYTPPTTYYAPPTTYYTPPATYYNPGYGGYYYGN